MKRQVKFLLSVCAFSVLWSSLNGGGKAERKIKTIMFGGDVCFGETYFLRLEQHRKENILKAKGYDYSFAKLDSLLTKPDVVIVNLETPVTDLNNSPLADSAKYKVHKGDVEKTPLTLKKHNISVVSLGNNHTMDYGGEGLMQTMEILKKNKIDFFGAGRNESVASTPYKIECERKGKKLHVFIIGGLAYANRYEESFNFYASENKAGVRLLAEEKIQEQVKKIRSVDTSAFIIVFPHWLENYRWKSKKQTELCHKMIDAGVDLIIGHGTHMFQEIEQYKGKWIVYSLGNFIFNSPGRFDKTKAHPYSLAAMLTINDKPEEPGMTLQLYPIFSDNLITGYQPHLANKNEFEECRHLLWTHSPDSILLNAGMIPSENKYGLCFEMGLSEP